MSITYSLLSSTTEIRQVLALQQANLPKNLSETQKVSQGFVTLEHHFELLEKINQVSPSIIATSKGDLAGYCLAMTAAFESDFPVLAPMFALIHQKIFNGKLMTAYNYMYCGQVCVAEKYRGQGVFDTLYHRLRQQYESEFDVLITYVARKNPRSIKAHQRVGFEIVHEEVKEDGGGWMMVAWDFKKAKNKALKKTKEE